MRVHHLNCTSIHTQTRFRGVTHCLLIETDEGLVLVDTGFGTQDYAEPTRFLSAFMAVNGVPRDLEETAIRQIEGLGLAAEDVRHIVLTHLHVDHAGALPDFPWAKVHVYAPEYEAAMRPARLSFKEQVGYAAAHWAHGPDWVFHALEGERWFGLDCVSVIDRALCEVLLVPLVGHSRGHCAVAVRTADGWLLHCGDAYVRQMQVDLEEARSPFPGWIRPLADWMFPPEPLVRVQALLRQHGDQVQAFCAHDRVAFTRLRGA